MKKRFILLVILIIFCQAWGYPQSAKTDPVVVRDKKGNVQSVEFPNGLDGNISIDTFLSSYLNVSQDDEFRKVPHKQRNESFVHDHYDQYYKGIKIDGAGYNFHYKDGKLFFAHGRYVRIRGLSVDTNISDEQAKSAFAKFKGIPEDLITRYKTTLLIKEIEVIQGSDTVSNLVLVYQTYLYADHPENTEIGFVDALKGEVLFTEPDHLDFFPATGTFDTRYNGTRTATTQYYNGAFHLSDSTRNAIIHTWDLNNTINLAGRSELSDNDNNWTSAEYSGNKTDMGLDIHWALQQIYDRLYNVHGINSFNNPVSGAGAPIHAHIRYGNNDYSRDNAFWLRIDSALAFGQGVTTFRPLASIDVIAHEYGHGIAAYQIGWGASDVTEMALNEGLSDIWGAIMEYRINPGNVWQTGEQIVLGKECLRDLGNTDNPNAHTQIANTFGSSDYNTGDQYVKSGVFSHWAYLLVNGGSGMNNVSNNYTVYGVGMDMLENLIVEAVFNNYLDNTSTYAQVRTAMENAASAVCGHPNGVLVQQVKNAWYAVNVGSKPDQASILGTHLLCANETYSIENLPAGVTVSWSTSNPFIMNLDSSTGVATATGRGQATITATISGSSCGSIKLARTIWVGLPAFDIMVADPLCVGTIYEAEAVKTIGETYATSYNWWSSSPNLYIDPFFSEIARISGSGMGSYYLYATATNACGTSDTQSLGIDVVICMSGLTYEVFPNPARDKLFIDFGNENPGVAQALSYRLYHESSTNPVRSIDAGEGLVSENNRLMIPVDNLPRGTYYLHLATPDGKTDKVRVKLE